jgi:ABC-2 type transport system ATP-binding protein
MPLVIHCEAITRHFGSRTAVEQVSLQIEQGEVFGLLGPNGAGKTTLVRLLNGLLEPDAGNIRVVGMNPVTQGNAIRQRTGVLTETPALYERLSARDNLRFFATLYGVPEAQVNARVDELLTLFELSARGGDKAGGYSKGMKQRLAIARALVHEPELLFFDEPTSGLDPESARQVDDLIEKLNRGSGRTVFLCTHNLEEAQRLCTRIGIINNGRLLAQGTPDDLAKQLWQGAWVDITFATSPSDDVLDTIRQASDFKSLAPVEAQISLSIELHSSEGIPRLVASIAAAGGQIMRVQPRQYTLEDIYFRVQQHNDEKRQA